MLPPVIRVDRLTKEYGAIRAVDGLSFSVNPGEIYGFLGQNGAGKSTTIRMLLTLVRPTAGSIEIFGLNLHQHRQEILRRVGAVVESPGLYTYLTGQENISLFAKMSGRSVSARQIRQQLELVGLAGRAGDKVKSYSLGMKQRLGIAVALVHDPELIVLDEPTNGLDPQGIADIRRLILQLGKQGKTILMSSHLLNEVEQLADRILVIDQGLKKIEGPVHEFFDPRNMLVELTVANAVDSSRLIGETAWQSKLERSGNGQFIFRMNQTDIPAMTAGLAARGVQIMQIQPRHSLEDFFLSVTAPNQHVDAVAN